MESRTAWLRPGMGRTNSPALFSISNPWKRAASFLFVGGDGSLLRPRKSALPHRICLLGESAAAGMFYSPRVTPARILARYLGEIEGPERFEVIDLTLTAQTDWGLLDVAVASLQLNPSLLVAFAGNNWVWSGLGPSLGFPAGGRLGDFQESAAVLEEHGVPGLKDLVERRVREQASRCIDFLARRAALAKVPLLWVVPEVNLPDVNPPHPVYWLAGDGTRLWYRGHERASRRLQRGQFAAAASEAERLIALDGGACAESHGLLAKAWWGLGRRELARAAFRAQVDAATWDRRFRRASGVSSTVLAAIRAECRHHGVATVDLPEVFDQYCGSALPGRRMFLDHCHLTLEGMTVAMAAVATAVARALPRKGKSVPDWQDLARELPPPEVPAAVAGLAQLQAGLYNGNLNYHNWELIEELFSKALETCPALRDAMQDYVLARAAPCSPWLTAACRRNSASPHKLDARVWRRWDLGADVLERLCRVLVLHGCEVEQQIVAAWIQQNELPPEGVEARRAKTLRDLRNRLGRQSALHPVDLPRVRANLDF